MSNVENEKSKRSECQGVYERLNERQKVECRHLRGESSKKHLGKRTKLQNFPLEIDAQETTWDVVSRKGFFVIELFDVDGVAPEGLEIVGSLLSTRSR